MINSLHINGFRCICFLLHLMWFPALVQCIWSARPSVEYVFVELVLKLELSDYRFFCWSKLAAFRWLVPSDGPTVRSTSPNLEFGNEGTDWTNSRFPTNPTKHTENSSLQSKTGWSPFTHARFSSDSQMEIWLMSFFNMRDVLKT